jgi:hypothetical protein
MTHPHEDRIALEVKRNEIESRRRESCGYTWRMLSSFSTSFRIIIRKHIWWLGAARYCGLIRKWKLVERITGNRTWFVRLNGEKGKECFESLVAMREYLDITRSNPERLTCDVRVWATPSVSLRVSVMIQSSIFALFVVFLRLPLLRDPFSFRGKTLSKWSKRNW